MHENHTKECLYSYHLKYKISAFYVDIFSSKLGSENWKMAVKTVGNSRLNTIRNKISNFIDLDMLNPNICILISFITYVFYLMAKNNEFAVRSISTDNNGSLDLRSQFSFDASPLNNLSAICGKRMPIFTAYLSYFILQSMKNKIIFY